MFDWMADQIARRVQERLGEDPVTGVEQAMEAQLVQLEALGSERPGHLEGYGATSSMYERESPS